MNQSDINSQIVYWTLSPELEASTANCNRNALGKTYKELSFKDLCKIQTEYNEQQLTLLLEFASKKTLPQPLTGVGIDLGSGVALYSACIVKMYDVKKIYSVELSKAIVEYGATRVVKRVLREDSIKVQLVVGSFNELHLGDNTLDFAVDLNSFHHSDDLTRTFKEVYRVLKPGGVLLCIDRVQPNSLTDKQVDTMLSQTYSAEFLKQYNLPEDSHFTRRENGEHEYRLFEWEYAFKKVGFSQIKMIAIHPSVNIRSALKGILNLLPRGITSNIYKTPSDISITIKWLRQIFDPFYYSRHGTRPLSIFSLHKPS